MGRKLAVVPAHPRLARLLVAAAESGLLNQGAALAALMAEKDIVLPGRGPAGGMASTSDLIYRLQLLDQAERARFAPSLLDVGVDAAAARQACKTRDELLRIGRHLGSPARPNPNKPPQSGGLLTQVAQFAQNRCDFRLKKGA
jgi:ATP-dependent helicase HrpB